MIYTSYFAKYKKDKLQNGVAISRGVPRGWKGERLIELAPSWDLIKADLTQDEYIDRYCDEVLEKLDINKIVKKIKGKTLLCWEESEWFCQEFLQYLLNAA